MRYLIRRIVEHGRLLRIDGPSLRPSAPFFTKLTNDAAKEEDPVSTGAMKIAVRRVLEQFISSWTVVIALVAEMESSPAGYCEDLRRRWRRTADPVQMLAGETLRSWERCCRRRRISSKIPFQRLKLQTFRALGRHDLNCPIQLYSVLVAENCPHVPRGLRAMKAYRELHI